MESEPKVFDFGYFEFVLFTLIIESCKDLFFLELTIACIRSDIFKIEVNGAFATHIIVHNSLTQNQNRLNFLDLSSLHEHIC